MQAGRNQQRRGEALHTGHGSNNGTYYSLTTINVTIGLFDERDTTAVSI